MVNAAAVGIVWQHSLYTDCSDSLYTGFKMNVASCVINPMTLERKLLAHSVTIRHGNEYPMVINPCQNHR